MACKVPNFKILFLFKDNYGQNFIQDMCLIASLLIYLQSACCKAFGVLFCFLFASVQESMPQMRMNTPVKTKQRHNGLPVFTQLPKWLNHTQESPAQQAKLLALFRHLGRCMHCPTQA